MSVGPRVESGDWAVALLMDVSRLDRACAVAHVMDVAHLMDVSRLELVP